MKAKTKKSRKRRALTALCRVLAVVLALMLTVTFAATSFMNRMNRVDGSADTMSAEEMQEYLDHEKQEDTDINGPAINENEVEWGDVVDTVLGDSDDVINILLIGQDRREGESRARSDSMILCTVNRNTKSIILTSFMRDLYVQIPGYGSNRINASYVWGGMELLNQTLEQNFGIHVDGNVEVDFNQFSEIVDLLGGVPMDLREDEAKLINSEVGGTLVAGHQRLNGDQALTYARIRKLDADADFSRTNRQRKLINALLGEVKDSGLVTLLKLLDEVLPMVTTDMTNGEILGYAAKVFPMLSKAEITSQRVPADGAYSGAMINGMAVLVADMNKTRQMLRETLGG